MKPSNPSRVSRASLALSASFLLAATAVQGNTTFSFYFNNGTGGTRNSALHQWTTSVGTSGTLVSTAGASAPNAGSGVSNGNAVAAIAGQSSLTGFAYYLPDASVAPGATPGVLMLYGNNTNTDDAFQSNQDKWARVGTETLTGLTVGAISQLSVYTRPATTATVMRFAIKVDGAWYASATSFTQTDVNVYEQRVVNPNSINWISGIGVTGASLDDDLSDNPSAPLSASGVVTNYGWYADTNAQTTTSARVRIDSYQIATVETDPYATWIVSYYPLVDPRSGRNEDPDGDGIANVFEFITGSLPNDNTSAFPVAVAPPSGGNVVFSYRQTSASLPLAPEFELSASLSSWDLAVDGVNDVTITSDFIDAGTDLMHVSLPSSSAYHFGRLSVVNP